MKDAVGTIGAVHRLIQVVGCGNLLIKVPATASGIEAFCRLTSECVSVNVTLIFSEAPYEGVLQASLCGALRSLESGRKTRYLCSVASIVVSCIDTHVDKLLDTLETPHELRLRGQAGIALAKICHGRFRKFSMVRISPRRHTVADAALARHRV